MKDKILQLRLKGLTYKKISTKLGCSKSLVSYYCGDSQKEKHRQRAIKNLSDKCECGERKRKKSTLCQECANKLKRKRLLNKTIEEHAKSYKNNSEFNPIRQVANLVLIESGRDKKCEVCGFDLYVEVCHIKPIKSFLRNTPLTEVNSLDNLIYLCPNHHRMLDDGLLEL